MRSWATLVVAVVLTLLSGLAPATTSTASASTFIYDAPAVAHVAGHASLARLAGSQRLSGSQEGSAPRSPSAPGASTALVGPSVATESVSPTVGELRSAGQADAHHIIQDAAVRDIPGYKTNSAPGVQLEGPSTTPGTPHYNATQVQRSTSLGGTYGAERQVACAALSAAGMSADAVASAIARSDAYFIGELGLSLNSPTRIPGNRSC